MTNQENIIATIEDADTTLMDMGEICQVLVGTGTEEKNMRLSAMARIFAELIGSARASLDDAARQIFLLTSGEPEGKAG